MLRFQSFLPSKHAGQGSNSAFGNGDAGEFPLARVDFADPGGTCPGPGRLVACSSRRITG
jgi:hypothetical protein